ncbi:MaoC family dehydratase [Effusibacillus consociatus]|uniref:MaoC family dehydratase n=1 Tax=Effusibacillus consociatus TaxID=1117041 RepID=A0ABV9PWL9_9BACL
MKFYAGQQASFSRTITETDFVQFAGLSGDYNPIHVDQEYAKDTRFGQRIAHGLLTTSLLSRLLRMHLPGPGCIYMGQTLRFVKPVFIGDTLTALAEVIEYFEEKQILRLKTECRKQDGTLVMEGEATMMVAREGEKI